MWGLGDLGVNLGARGAESHAGITPTDRHLAQGLGSQGPAPNAVQASKQARESNHVGSSRGLELSGCGRLRSP